MSNVTIKSKEITEFKALRNYIFICRRCCIGKKKIRKHFEINDKKKEKHFEINQTLLVLFCFVYVFYFKYQDNKMPFKQQIIQVSCLKTDPHNCYVGFFVN